MIDFSLTEEQEQLRALVREFGQREVKPVAAEYDAKIEPSECLPLDLFEKAHKLGLRTLPLYKKYGGGGIDLLTAAILLEEACYWDVGFGIGLQQIWMVIQVLQEIGSQEQCEKYMPQIRDDPHFFLSAAACEPEAGTDVFLPNPDPKTGIRLTAERKGDEVVLNGTKHMIAFGHVSKLLLVFARTDKTKPMMEGTTMFLVTPDAPGFNVQRVFNPMGWRLFPTAELFFDNCRIPRENQVRGWNEAHTSITRTVAIGTAYAGAYAVGMARAAFERALEYAKIRVQGGKPIIEHNNTAMQLADMFIKIEAARYLYWKTCWNALHDEYWDPGMVRATKVFGSQMARDVTISAMELHGGSGVMRDLGVEKLVRDALTLLHVYGPNDINLISLGRSLKMGLGPNKR